MPDVPETSPQRILLATDLSHRCDRALDRAVALARAWGAELIAATIIEPGPADDRTRRSSSWRRQASPTERMHWRLSRDTASVGGDIRIVIEEGDPAAALIAIAEREQCDLIVTGIARDETLGRILLGNTVNRLVRGSTTPILVVRERPVAAYANILVATDFSEAAFQAMLMASAFFPAAAMTLFHGYDLPYVSHLTDRDFTRETYAIECDTRDKFLADDRLDAALRDKLQIVVEHGALETLLAPYVEDKGIDLTIVGSQGRGPLFDALIGSMDKKLLETLEGDLLIVRQRNAEEAAE